MEPFLGQVLMFGGNFAPRGWAFCNGQLLSISTNQALFSILGTTYGGDGRTTFALPDLRGRAPLHPGTGPGLSTHRLGARSGMEYNTLSVMELANHTHSGTAAGLSGIAHASSAAATDSTPAAGGSVAAGDNGSGTPLNAYLSAAPDTALSNTSVAVISAPIQVGTSGGSTSMNNMMPYETVSYIIALVGIFPSRN